MKVRGGISRNLTPNPFPRGKGDRRAGAKSLNLSPNPSPFRRGEQRMRSARTLTYFYFGALPVPDRGTLWGEVVRLS
jgi:hypothetical protein